MGASVLAVFGVVFGVEDVPGVVHVALVPFREEVVGGVVVVQAPVESEQASVSDCLVCVVGGTPFVGRGGGRLCDVTFAAC